MGNAGQRPKRQGGENGDPQQPHELDAAAMNARQELRVGRNIERYRKNCASERNAGFAHIILQY
jgi:hypothetical protein